MNIKQVILVDEQDKPVGVAEKMQAHEKGLLHRAFSVFIFNSQGEMLLQQRALHKYHSGGLWTNACCSHPVPGEETLTSVQKRLKEEIGIETPVNKLFEFVYKTQFTNGLTEYEYDHVFTGEYDGLPAIDENEIMDYCFKTMSELRNELKLNPQKYTSWFQIAFPEVDKWWGLRYKELTV